MNTLEKLKGYRTYTTIALAIAYLIATKLGIVEYNETVKNSLELVSLGFIRAALGAKA